MREELTKEQRDALESDEKARSRERVSKIEKDLAELSPEEQRGYLLGYITASLNPPLDPSFKIKPEVFAYVVQRLEQARYKRDAEKIADLGYASYLSAGKRMLREIGY